MDRKIREKKIRELFRDECWYLENQKYLRIYFVHLPHDFLFFLYLDSQLQLHSQNSLICLCPCGVQGRAS